MVINMMIIIKLIGKMAKRCCIPPSQVLLHSSPHHSDCTYILLDYSLRPHFPAPLFLHFFILFYFFIIFFSRHPISLPSIPIPRYHLLTTPLLPSNTQIHTCIFLSIAKKASLFTNTGELHLLLLIAGAVKVRRTYPTWVKRVMMPLLDHQENI